jgi:hypothetical protein
MSKQFRQTPPALKQEPGPRRPVQKKCFGGANTIAKIAIGLTGPGPEWRHEHCSAGHKPKKMSTISKLPKKSTALGLSQQSVSQIITSANHYVQCMTGNVHFPAPTPTLAAVDAQILVLTAAYNVSLTRVKGAANKMHVELSTLKVLLKGLAGYVETMANADPQNAENIINSSGMPVKKTPVHQPKIFSAVAMKTPGMVRLNSKAVPRASYVYEMTTDLTNAASWTNIFIGGQVKFDKTGLTSGTRYYFRVAVSIKGVLSAWSHDLSVLVP